MRQKKEDRCSAKIEGSPEPSRRPLLRLGVRLAAAVALVGVGISMLTSSGPESLVLQSAIAAPLSVIVGALRRDRVRWRDRPERDLLIVGRNRRTQAIIDAADQVRSVHVIGVLDCEEVTGRADEEFLAFDRVMTDLRIPYLGSHDRLSEVLSQAPVDEVLLTLPIKSCYDQITHCLQVCQEAGIPASVSTSLFELERTNPDLKNGPRGGSRLSFPRTRWPRWKAVIKRGMDIVGALVALTIFAIPMLLTALAVKLTSRGPVLFWQERVGLNGKPFLFPKFRSMVAGADRMKDELTHLNEQDGPVFKVKKDPRITRVGRFIRKYSLDELPQLLCVLSGRMSLVGPRPPVPREVAEYEWWQRRRLSVKPGLTCLWQVKGRNDIPFQQWMRLDLEYIDSWSLGLDCKLLLLTVPAVLRGSGM